MVVADNIIHAMSDSDSTTPSLPNHLALAAAVMLAAKDGKLTEQDTETMDHHHPEDWPKEIWEKLGFSPPTPKAPETPS